VIVDDRLAVEGLQGVWAAGDCAAVPDPDGGFCPPTAQHAVRQSRVAARNIAAAMGMASPARFEYHNKGQFVNLGRYKAVGRLGKHTVSGFPAWWMARTYHMSQIPGSARKVRALVDWTTSLPFHRDLAELGSIGHPRPLKAEVYARGGSHRPLP
jgi:NADH dehydrogenase